MVDIKPLSPELQAVANEELFEVPSRIPEDLSNFKLWISQQPHLKVRNDDQFLIQFLRASKYRLEQAKGRIDLYYTLRSKYPELFHTTDIESPEIKKVLNLGYLTLLPKPLNDCGPRIALYRLNFTLPEYSFNDIMRSSVAMFDLALVNDPYACIYGVSHIIDVANININHILHATPSFLKKAFAYFSKNLPLRINSVYFINSSPLSLQLFRLMIPFFPDKVKNRTFVCGSDLTELTSRVPLQYLPKEYGGENGSVDELTVWWQKNLSAHASYFQENAVLGVDESLRPGKPVDFECIYGMEGSFRKLEVD